MIMDVLVPQLRLFRDPKKIRALIPRHLFNDSAWIVVAMIGCVAIPNCFLSVWLLLTPAVNVIHYLSVAAPLSSLFLYLAPVSSVKQAVAQQSTQNYPVTFFRIQLVCNLLVSAYGLGIRNFAVIIPNLFGLSCQLVWLSYGLMIEANEQKKPVQWLFFVLEFTIACNVALAVFEIIPSTLLSFIIISAQIALVCTPLLELGSILRARNRSSIDTPVTLMLILNNGLWTGYGALIRDAVVFWPSIVSYMLAFFQGMIILWCEDLLPFDLSPLIRIIPDKQKAKASIVARMQDKRFSTLKRAQSSLDTQDKLEMQPMSMLRRIGQGNDFYGPEREQDALIREEPFARA